MHLHPRSELSDTATATARQHGAQRRKEGDRVRPPRAHGLAVSRHRGKARPRLRRPGRPAVLLQAEADREVLAHELERRVGLDRGAQRFGKEREVLRRGEPAERRCWGRAGTQHRVTQCAKQSTGDSTIHGGTGRKRAAKLSRARSKQTPERPDQNSARTKQPAFAHHRHVDSLLQAIKHR